MSLPASRRRNYKRTPSGKVRRLPDVPGIKLERQYWTDGAVVAGVDEVGRGAWAGPVTFAAIVLPSDRRMYKLRDSKLLDAQRREELAGRLGSFAVSIGIGHAGNDEIDRLGMSEAMRQAARRAVDALDPRPDVLLLDGNWDFLAGYGTHNERVVYGDAISASIAAASIVAKVTRDRLMTAAAPDHPLYGFASNKGYPSPLHRRALRTHGPCVLHRHSWAPIAALLHPTLFGVDGEAGWDGEPMSPGEEAARDEPTVEGACEGPMEPEEEAAWDDPVGPDGAPPWGQQIAPDAGRAWVGGDASDAAGQSGQR